jgi:hypothetical protein
VTASFRNFFQEIKAEIEARSLEIHPWQSYWYHRPALNFPPPSPRDPADFEGGERLSLACTQTDLPAFQQKKLVAAWCEKLPNCHSVKTLWFQTKVTQELFEAACQMPHLESLYIKWGALRSLEPLLQLKKIRHLHLGSAPSAEPISVLSQLTTLVDLEIENNPGVCDLRFLEPLTALESLSVTGQRNSLKKVKIKNLAPLARLTQLKRLMLTTLILEEPSLDALRHLPKLKYLLLSNQFEMEEIARLAALLPEVDCDLFAPVSEAYQGILCKTCKQSTTMVMLTGKGKPWRCLNCQTAQIEAHRTQFFALRDACFAAEKV